MTHQIIYLDYNATAPLRPEAMMAMKAAFQHYGNPSSIHAMGRKARSLVESAREIIANSMQVKPSQIVFTSGGTEANNLALKGFEQHGARLFISAIEHESVAHATSNATIISVDSNGIIDLAALDSLLAHERSQHSEKILIAIMLANNETGVIQPISEIVSMATQYNANVHCDAVQALGKINFNFVDLGVDSLALSAHKIGGPKGIGALIVKEKIQLPSLLKGGGQERGSRAGTENVSGIVGFGAAIAAAQNDNWNRIEKLRNDMESVLCNQFSEVPIYGKQAPRLPNTSYIGMPGVISQNQLMAFDLEHICVSTGAACTSGKVTPSQVLKVMGISESATNNAIRISLGWETTRKEIDKFIEVWVKVYRRSKENE